MNKRVVIGLVGGAVAVGVAVPSAVSAAPPSSGANVIAVSAGGSGHTVCASQDVYLVANGFAANRGSTTARVTIVGNGPFNPLFYETIKLTGGAGSTDTGSPGEFFIGAKFRVRYQTGSTGNKVNYGSYSATITDC